MSNEKCDKDDILVSTCSLCAVKDSMHVVFFFQVVFSCTVTLKEEAGKI